jgi:endonuclease/exonuclease/phosphatase (EEP) superfamily protein YafD
LIFSKLDWQHANPLEKFVAVVERGTVALGVLTIVSFFGQGFWLFDLFSHFRMQLVFALVATMVILALTKKGRMAGMALLFCLVNLAEIVPFYLPQKSLAEENRPRLRVLTVNVNFLNPNADLLLDCIHNSKPDIIAVEELNPNFESLLNEKLVDYPYRKSIVRRDPYGIGVYSRIPFSNAEIKYFSGEVPSISLHFNWKNKPIYLVATHPLPPLSPDLAFYNTEQLKAISEDVRNQKETTIVLGDFNATSWCSAFKSLEQTGRLIDTRTGFGVQPSWLTDMPLASLPIDHCLTTPDLVTALRQIGPSVGSDHNPLLVDLQRAL